jgi:TolB-like protein
VTITGLGASGMVIRQAIQQESLAEAVEQAGLDLRSIAVLYFEDMTADGSIGAVADGVTEGLIRALSQVRDLDVASRNAARQVRGLDVNPDSIASLLGAGTLVDGTVDQEGDELMVGVRVLEGSSGIPIWREYFSWPVEDIATVGDDLAAEVANGLREVLGEEIRLRTGRASAPTSAAWLRVARAERSLVDAQEAVQRGDGAAVADAFDAAAAELDQLLELAEDEGWAEPFVLRGRVSYERYILAGTVDEFIGTLSEAAEFADRALDIEPNHAGALELRGTATYRRWLLQAEDEDVLDRLLDNAQDDLDQATILDQSRASAYSTLSHLFYQVGEWDQAVLAARQAYNEDAFLDAADGVLWRLYAASYDLGRHGDAEDWCLEGRERFPDNFRFVQCQIFLMTMNQAQPDVELAWELLTELGELAPPGQEAYLTALGQLAVGAVVGRAGMADSANAVFVAARVSDDVDPVGELQSIEAAMRSVIGDVDGSIQVLRRFMSAHPDHFPGEHWWWRNVEADPAFERLQGSS